MRLKINLATRRYVNMRRLNALFAAVALILVVFFGYLVQRVSITAGELARIERASAAEAAHSRTGETVSKKQMDALGAKIRFANTLIAAKTLDWPRLLTLLEGVVPDGVSLTSLEPSPKDQTLKIAGDARSFANIRTFMENLEASKEFTKVYLLTQNDIEVGKTQKGLAFGLSCKVALQ